MKIRLSDLWTWRGSMKRAEFIFWGLILFVIKYNLDRFLMWKMSGQRWSLLDYTKVSEYLWPKLPSLDGAGDFAALLLLSLPFMVAGVLLTLKRLRSTTLPPSLVLLFFIPVVKVIFFLLLCVLPSRDRLETEQGGRAATRAGLDGSFRGAGKAVLPLGLSWLR